MGFRFYFSLRYRQALRDNVPGYDPVKDPNPLNNPSDSPLVRPIEPHGKNLGWWLIGGGVLVTGLLYARRK